MVTADMRALLLKLLPAVGMLVVVVVFVRLRGLSWTSDLRLVAPKLEDLALWLPVWVAWVLASERLAPIVGIAAPEPWTDQTTAMLVVRFAGMVLLAPFAEELLFRGLLFGRIEPTQLGVAGAVIVPALVFAAVHIQYGLVECAWILFDAVLFGVARAHSGSLLVPMMMHAMGNAYAFYQRFPR